MCLEEQEEATEQGSVAAAMYEKTKSENTLT